MKFSKFLILAAAVTGCISCIKTNPEIGGNLIPSDQRYQVFSVEFPLEEIQMKMADSLSGYSGSRITVGAVRDGVFGLTARECALTLIPLYDTLNFGNVQKVKSFHLNARFDTVSVVSKGDERILQSLYATKITPGVDMKRLVDANDVAGKMSHGSESILKGHPVIDGKSNLDIDLSEEFAWDFIRTANGMILSKQFPEYLEKFPGIYLSTDTPVGNGGRINTFKLPVNYNSSKYYMEDNYGSLQVSSIFEGKDEPVDTTFFFYYGGLDYHPLDSILTSSSSAGLAYAVNLSKHSTRGLAKKAADKVLVEGGAGLKPVIEAKVLRQNAHDAIMAKLLEEGYSADDAQKVIINKASLILPFETDDYTEIDNFFPPRISPTCRVKTDTTAEFTYAYMGLSDASSESENQGDINRNIMQYQPDVTYHLQQLLTMKEGSNYYNKYLDGEADIWFLLMNLETTTTTSEGDSDYSEYLQYLMYQNYYNNMYGSGYGYGSGSSYYNNYYSYMMAAMYASGSQTTTSTDYKLDQDLYYRAALCGPDNPGRKPSVKLSFSIPKK